MAERRASAWVDCTPTTVQAVSSKPLQDASEGPCLKFASEAQRIVEQIVLYRRMLYYLNYAFRQATKAWQNERIKPTEEIRRRLKDCNDLYHRSYIRLRHLARHSKRQDLLETVSQLLGTITANKLIFHYAMDQCMAAEMDEYVGDVRLAVQRYKAAIILMHGLIQHAKTENDKSVLGECMRLVRQRHGELMREEQEQFILLQQQHEFTRPASGIMDNVTPFSRTNNTEVLPNR
ncbi:Serine/threonine-protein kinase ulk2 [Cichlidogyrus casuarinus]|uniref:Serine/threonine-protein kinase ulk2 n=1 Tax=Cichlidogyrus casuarinus TaxID=1844966 RepID=A0ABD2PQY1_9PLAT